MKFAASLLLLAVAAASPEIRYFRYERPLQNAPQQPGQACLALDAGVFAQAAPQLYDLRLYRDATETPYVIRVAAEVEAGEKSILPLNLGVRGGQTSFDADLPALHYNDVQLAVAAKDFIATVTVSGSQTQNYGQAGGQARSPETKLGSYTIFDLTRQKLGRSTVLHLPESDFRYLHFRIAGALTPDNITGLSVERVPAKPPRYVTVAESVQITQKGHSSVVEFTVPAHVPIDRVAISLGAEPALFSREILVSAAPANPTPGADGVEPPQTVTSSGSLLRIHRVQEGQRIDEERLQVPVRWTELGTAAKWTVSIDNGDDPPLKIESVQLQMLERNLCFEAVAPTGYTLYYGDPALTAPRYDYATLFTPDANSARISAGPEQPNPAYQVRPDDRPFTEKHPALLWVALIAVIALLGGIALRSAKQTTPTAP